MARAIRWHCCKLTCTDGKNKKMPSLFRGQECPSLSTLLQIFLKRWQEQYDGVTANSPSLTARTKPWHHTRSGLQGAGTSHTDGKNKMMPSFFKRQECPSLSTLLQILLNRWQEQYDGITANSPSLTARTKRWHHTRSGLQGAGTSQHLDIAANCSASMASTM